MENTSIQNFARLLAEYAKLPRKKQTRTFMQVAGYPHYENVCSNILAFYFDPTEEHGMGDLLLRALMTCIHGKSFTGTIIEAPAEREQRTESGLRLDLLITTEDFIVGIEHKIWAALYNDLDEYAKLLKARAKEAEIPEDCTYRVVLSLRDLEGDEKKKAAKAGFIGISHARLITEARNLLGHYAAAADTKFLTYFTDFMATIESLTGPAPDAERLKFFRANSEQLHELGVAYWNFIAERPRVVGKCLDELLGRDPGELSHPKQWIASKSILVNDINVLGRHKGKLVSTDAYFGHDGWSITVFCRMKIDWAQTPDCKAYLQELRPLLRLDDFAPNGSRLEKILPPTLPDVEVAHFLKDLLTRIMDVVGYTKAPPSDPA